MSREEEPAAGAPGGAAAHAASLSVALSGASRDKADAFLDKQAAFTDQLMAELKEENPLKLSCLRARRFNGYARMGLEISIGLLVLALVAGISLMVWNAAHSEGLVIESFSVPPDIAAKGINGQVIASKTLDELIAIQSNKTARTPKSIANNWGDDIKVEIPETGVSVGEIFRFLKNWLGRETHISGEAVRTASGIAITARVSGGFVTTVSGSEGEMDALVRKVAENIYGATQPYRYGVYLNIHGRTAEAITVFKGLAATGPMQERPWGYIGWANALTDTAQRGEMNALLQKALALQPDNVLALNNLTNGTGRTGREQETLDISTRTLAALRAAPSAMIVPAQLAAFQKQTLSARARLLGDWREAVRQTQESIDLGASNTASQSYVVAIANARAHDLAAARAALVDPAKAIINIAPGLDAVSAIQARMAIAFEAGDWAGLLVQARAIDPLMRQYPGVRSNHGTVSVPLIAQAQARLGNFPAAEALIAPTPGDCGPCLRARGWIAALQGQNRRADGWFSRAVAAAPSIPFANAEWGQVLLARGQPDAAIEKFKLASRKGPKFADPLEGWGEALMAKNQSHLALAKFAQANQHAPNWGRLHLKWGEALLYSGKADEAKKQFAIAARLDLTPSEKIQLAGLRR